MISWCSRGNTLLLRSLPSKLEEFRSFCLYLWLHSRSRPNPLHHRQFGNYESKSLHSLHRLFIITYHHCNSRLQWPATPQQSFRLVEGVEQQPWHRLLIGLESVANPKNSSHKSMAAERSEVSKQCPKRKLPQLLERPKGGLVLILLMP